MGSDGPIRLCFCVLFQSQSGSHDPVTVLYFACCRISSTLFYVAAAIHPLLSSMPPISLATGRAHHAMKEWPGWQDFLALTSGSYADDSTGRSPKDPRRCEEKVPLYMQGLRPIVPA